MIKRMAILAVALAAAGAAATAQDFDFKGVSSSKVKSLKEKTSRMARFAPANFLFKSSGKAFACPFDEDVPADIQKQIKEDMAFIGTVKGSAASQLHQKIFGAIDGPSYQKFFGTRVKAIGMDDCGSSNAVACVIPYASPSKMWLTQNYIKFSHPQIARLMVVFHESRHTETANGFWSHARCPVPFVDASGKPITSIWTGSSLAGEPACDATPFGSYGSSMIMLKNIQKFCTNCTDKVKMDAGIYADDQYKRITDAKAALQIKNDLYK